VLARRGLRGASILNAPLKKQKATEIGQTPLFAFSLAPVIDGFAKSQISSLREHLRLTASKEMGALKLFS